MSRSVAAQGGRPGTVPRISLSIGDVMVMVVQLGERPPSDSIATEAMSVGPGTL